MMELPFRRDSIEKILEDNRRVALLPIFSSAVSWRCGLHVMGSRVPAAAWNPPAVPQCSPGRRFRFSNRQ